jgi:hypothetical protein
MHQKHLLLPVMFIITGIFYSSTSIARAEFSYKSGDEVYRYAVVQSGDYYNFEFDKDPGMMLEQYKAGVHVLRSVYNDTSIELENRQNYIRERARCSLFAGNFYNYSFCILPNDFSPNKQGRFRGFITQLPNWKWHVTRILLPLLLAFGLYCFLMKKR